MSSTGLIAEVLLLGGQASVWLVAVALLLAPEPIKNALASSQLNWNELATLLAVPGIAVTYALGWSIGFVAHRALFLLIKAYKVNPFKNEADTDDPVVAEANYKRASIHFYQFASPALVQVHLLDRHVMRLARGTALNFALIAVALLFHALKTPSLFWAVALATLVSAIMMWHWTVRAKNYYGQIQTFRDIVPYITTPPIK